MFKRKSVFQLGRSYPALHAPMKIDRVQREVFTYHYFTDCMGCLFCHDLCCSYGADVDVLNVEKILSQGEALGEYILTPAKEWFETEYELDEEYPGGKYTRTSVKDNRCVFLNRAGRGCNLHRFALEKGMDYHDIKPLVCSLFPITFNFGQLEISQELRDGSLICSKMGPTAYRGNRNELLHYFGPELVAELDEIEAVLGVVKE